MSLPNIAPAVPLGKGDCLCRKCLIEQINATLHAYYQTHTNEELVAFAAEHNRFNTYIEGLDYVVEDGEQHPTKWHLLKQGQCCLENCQYCPYK